MTEQTWGQTAPGTTPDSTSSPDPDAPSADSFFAQASGNSGPFGPSFHFEGVNSGLMGTIVSRKVELKTNPGDKSPKLDKRGQKQYQLHVVLQTDLRNWEGVKNTPTSAPDAAGVRTPLPPSEDTGLRSIYLWYTLRDAVHVAVAAAGQQELVDGATLGVKVVGLKKNNMGGNPIKEYTAVYYLPGQGPAPQSAPVQQQPVAQPQAQQQPVQQQNAPAQDPWAAAPPNLGADAPPF